MNDETLDRPKKLVETSEGVMEVVEEEVKYETVGAGVTAATITDPSGNTHKIINTLPHHIDLYITDKSNITHHYRIEKTDTNPFRISETRKPVKTEGVSLSQVTYSVGGPLISLIEKYHDIMTSDSSVLLVVSPIAYTTIAPYLKEIWNKHYKNPQEEFIVEKMKLWVGKLVMLDTSTGAVRSKDNVVIGTRGFVGGTPSEIASEPFISYRKSITKPHKITVKNVKGFIRHPN